MSIQQADLTDSMVPMTNKLQQVFQKVRQGLDCTQTQVGLSEHVSLWAEMAQIVIGGGLDVGGRQPKRRDWSD